MEEDRQRRRHILDIILIGSIVMLLILDSIILFYSLREGAHYKEMSFAVFSVLPVFFLFLYALSRRGYSVLASYLLIFGYFASNSYAAYRWGVILQVVILAYAFIIIMATILRGPRFGFLTTGVIAAFIIPLWYAQFHGIITTQKQQLRSADGVVFAVLYILIMIVAWLYDREIEKSLLRAHTSENELRNQRDMLEVMVEERTIELRRTQFEKIEGLNRFAEMGQLSSGLFHDVFNLLNAISLRTDDGSELSIANALKTTRQIENFTQAVRRQLNRSEFQEYFSLNESIDHVTQLLAHKANKAHVRMDIADNAEKNIIYFGVPHKFHQVVLNLILNAIESFDSVAENTEIPRGISVELKEEENDTIMFCVTDNGCGMTAETISRIFDEFFTTKDSSKGIGIGLATTKRIVEKDLHGTIAVNSKTGQGSTFIITFPLNHGSLPESDRQSR